MHNQAKRLRQTHEENMMSRSAIVPTSKNMKILGSSTVDMGKIYIDFFLQVILTFILKVNRVRELEEENRDIRLQNKKQEASIKKYRERWEKLKEGAKKRQPNNTNSLLKSLASNDPSLLHQ